MTSIDKGARKCAAKKIGYISERITSGNPMPLSIRTGRGCLGTRLCTGQAVQILAYKVGRFYANLCDRLYDINSHKNSVIEWHTHTHRICTINIQLVQNIPMHAVLNDWNEVLNDKF